MSGSPRSGARYLQRLPYLNDYNVLKQESGFTLGLDTAKNIVYMKK